MFNKKLFLFLLIFLAITPLVRGQTIPDKPDIKDWKEIGSTVFDINLDNGLTAYLGYEVEYQSPANVNEFVIVLSRFVSFVSVPGTKTDKTPYVAIANSYLDNETNKALDDLKNNQSDSFLYVHWKTTVDEQTRQVVLEGPIENWLLGTNGIWFYKSGVNVRIKNISEPDRNKPEQFVTVGVRYSLIDVYHVLMVDQEYFLSDRKKD